MTAANGVVVVVLVVVEGRRWGGRLLASCWPHWRALALCCTAAQAAAMRDVLSWFAFIMKWTVLLS